jgi:hypothetical protein
LIVNEDLEALIFGGGTVTLKHNERGNVVCDWSPGPKDAELGMGAISEVGPTIQSVVVTTITRARRRNAQLVNTGKL